MLADHPEEQIVLLKEIIYKKLTVREAEKVSRKIAYDRIRKKEYMPDPEIIELEEELQDELGTRVHIERKDTGGQIKIDYFSTDDLRAILDQIKKGEIEKSPSDMLENHIAENTPIHGEEDISATPSEENVPIDDRSKEEVKEDDSKLYDITNFSL